MSKESVMQEKEFFDSYRYCADAFAMFAQMQGFRFSIEQTAQETAENLNRVIERLKSDPNDEILEIVAMEPDAFAKMLQWRLKTERVQVMESVFTYLTDRIDRFGSNSSEADREFARTKLETSVTLLFMILRGFKLELPPAQETIVGGEKMLVRDWSALRTRLKEVA